MRVLLVTPLYPPDVGGAATYFATLGRRLGELPGIERLAVLTRRRAGAPLRDREGRAQVLRLLPGAGLTGAPVLRHLAGAATVALVAGAARARRADVVHYHTMVGLRAMGAVARLAGAPLVADMRDLAARDEGVARRSYDHCRAIVCASESIAAFVAAAGVAPERIRHIPIPLEPPERLPAERVLALVAARGLPPGTPYVCFVGALMPEKGVAELLAAFEILRRARPSLRLVLVGPHRGDGGARDRLLAAARRAAGVHYLGPLPHGETLGVMQGASLVVLPSRTEGLPRVCLEAIALGVKTLCPAGVPELERACPGFTLGDLRPEALAASMAGALDAPGVPRYPLELHDPAAVARRVHDLYRDVLRSAR